MLSHLSIRNYALIDSLGIDFHPGFSTLTGETGAGKSIIIGALSLLAGSRADSTRLRDKQHKAVIEAEFTTDNIKHLRSAFEELGLEWVEDGLILRREIAPDGRSRIFVNDSPVTLKQLSSIGPQIIDIHSQHSNLKLEDPNFRLHIIDVMANNGQLLADYKECFHKYALIRNNLKRIKAEQSEAKSHAEYYRLQLDRLNKLAPKPGELKVLEQEQERLTNAETVGTSIDTISQSLWQGEVTALSQLDQARAAMTKIGPKYLAHNHEDGEELLKRIDTIYLELKDIAETVKDLDLEFDPKRLERVQQRIENYYDTMSSLSVATDQELIDKLRELQGKVTAADDTEAIQRLEHETATAAAALRDAATKLSESRKEAVEIFANTLTDIAKPLGMLNLKFKVDLVPSRMSTSGAETVEFLCSFNKNTPLMPVQKVASGGEISRLMLALKTLITKKLHIPVLIFDEVDTGVSGEIADKMGRMMSEIANDAQVIAITHLPQVASLGSRQYLVSKSDTEHSTLTAIRLLEEEERIEEIARMLSGENINDAARQNAKTLLNK